MINQELIKVYYDLMRFGIGSETVKLFPGAPKQFYRINDVCFFLETSRGMYFLWLVSEDEQRLETELELLGILEKKSREGFLYPIRLKDNRFYGALQDERFFYLTDWAELRPISFKNDIESLLGIIINFRSTITAPEYMNVKLKTSQKSLIDRYKDMIKSFASFATLARYRIHPTIFDRLYLRYYDGFVKEAKLALELIQDSVYLDRFELKESFRPIINNFSRSNLRTLPNGQGICLSLKKCELGAAIMDLALLMAKTGRANRWDCLWYERIIRTYNESFSLTGDDIKVIDAYLAFPWEAYRLAARYYYNRVNWPVRSFVEKMERLVKSEADRMKLLQ